MSSRIDGLHHVPDFKDRHLLPLSWFQVRTSLFIALALAMCGCFSQPPQPVVEVKQKIPEKPDTRRDLVIFGDSITAGYALQTGQSYPDDLQRKLDAQGYSWHVVNLGISG